MGPEARRHPLGGSLFSGVGGFELAFERRGGETRWQSEIDARCNGVLALRFPGALRLGDVTSVSGYEVEPVDVVMGGFPCQDLSVAGKRTGLAGARSGLFFEIVRIVREMRETTNGESPTFLVLENVDGLLTSHGGRDFATVLGALRSLGPLDICWRVLDSQFFGVPQRRNRCFLVVDFGGERAGEILFESDRVSRHPEPRRQARQDVTGPLADTTGDRGWSSSVDVQAWVPETAYAVSGQGSRFGSGREGQDTFIAEGVVGPLTTNSGPGSHDQGNLTSNQAVDAGYIIPADALAPPLAAAAGRSRGAGTADALPLVPDVAGPLGTPGGDRGGWPSDTERMTFITEAPARALKSRHNLSLDASQDTLIPTHALTAEGHDASEDGTGRGVPLVPDATHTLTGSAGQGVTEDGRGRGLPLVPVGMQAQGTNFGDLGTLKATDGSASRGTPLVAFTGKKDGGDAGEVAPTLRAMGSGKHINGGGQLAIAFTQNQREEVREVAVAGSLAHDPGSHQETFISRAQRIRRLTPLECERLQGFPDGWTAQRVQVTKRGRRVINQADSRRYQQMGNAITVSVGEWILRRLVAVWYGRNPDGEYTGGA